MSGPGGESSMQQLVPIAPPAKAPGGGGSGKELVVAAEGAGRSSAGGVRLREDEEDLEVKLRRVMENVPVRVNNTSGSSAGSGSGSGSSDIFRSSPNTAVLRYASGTSNRSPSANGTSNRLPSAVYTAQWPLSATGEVMQHASSSLAIVLTLCHFLTN